MQKKKKKKNQNTEKITFKVVQMKFLAMHITNQKLIWYIYSRKFTKYLHGTRSLLYILMIFGIKEKLIILPHTMFCWVLLPVLLMTVGFEVLCMFLYIQWQCTECKWFYELSSYISEAINAHLHSYLHQYTHKGEWKEIMKWIHVLKILVQHIKGFFWIILIMYCCSLCMRVTS